MKKFLKIFSALLVGGLLLGLLACNLPFMQISIGTPPTATSELFATELPTNSPMAEVPPTPANQRSYDSGVVHFSYDLSLFMDVDVQTIPAIQPDPNAMPFDVAPLHTELTLKGYVISNHFFTPKMYIFPATEFGAMLDFVQQDIDMLKLIIANQSSDGPDALPFLPPQSAAQIFRSNFQHIQFQNGAGIRYLSQYAQAIYPINNYMIFYTFQGITNDGKTYISLVMPVSNPVLPADGNTPPSGDWQTYLSGVVAQLNALPDNSFTPNLQLLDEMVQSITIK